MRQATSPAARSSAAGAVPRNALGHLHDRAGRGWSESADGPQAILLQESRQEIASRLSMKPETLSRILRTLADSGVLTVQGIFTAPLAARSLPFT